MRIAAPSFEQLKATLYPIGHRAPYAILPAVPVILDSDGMQRQMEVRVAGEIFVQEKRIDILNTPGRTLDPVALRNAFLAVESPESAIAFLQVCGPFLNHQPGMSTQTITWPEFLEWQRFAKDWVLHGKKRKAPWPKKPDSSQAHSAYDFFSEPDVFADPANGHPILKVTCKTALEVIGASFYIDKLQGINFAECPWCGKLFAKATYGGHEKRFCTPDHSRQAAKSQSRKEQKTGR